MLDQSFSAENFRHILDISNRKGLHVEDRLSMSRIRRINKNIKHINHRILEKRKLGDKDRVKFLHRIKEILREIKEKELTDELELISQNVTKKGFEIGLTKVEIPGGKTLYTTQKTPENFFALKQIQRNIARLFGVRQGNRHAIVGQVISLLGDQFPKYVIRTDIKEFYESIHHEPLLRRIHKDSLLSPLSRNVLTGVLNSYKHESGLNKGIPRGIGVSAYLAELYMRPVDNDIRDLKGVTFYARYVDDIIIIFTPSPIEGSRDYLNEVKDVVKKHKIQLNLTKTQCIDLRTNGSTHSISYLGYKIQFGSSKVKTQLTFSKVQKYRKRIKSAFDHYLNLSKIDEKTARNILVKRIRFLTGNTRLKNNKNNILVGVYYSNSHLTHINQLDGLDQYLSWQISHRIRSLHLRARLNKYSFKKGYEDKRFSPFLTSELSEIMKVWKKPY